MAIDQLDGTIERITYYSEETGYTVLRLKPEKPMPNLTARDGTVAVVGSFMPLHPGELCRFTGAWTTHPEYGRQFKGETVEMLTPASKENLRKYLASGAIKGVGRSTADRILKHFGENVLEILNENPHRLLEVPGISLARAEMIVESWQEKTHTQTSMVFLQGQGISAGLAAKIYKEYGEEAIQMVKANPYRLARDITGVGFKTADRIAQTMGFAYNSDERISAGVLYALESLWGEGHVYGPRDVVRNTIAELLNLTDESDITYVTDDMDDEIEVQQVSINTSLASRIDEMVTSLLATDELRIDMVPSPTDAEKTIEALYLPAMYATERGVAKRIRELVGAPSSRVKVAKTFSWVKFFSLLKQLDKISLTQQQQDAVEAVFSHKLSILTGGPGTGKTTTLRAVIKALRQNNASFALASPTGRAAKRLNEATGESASTLHRLLRYSPREGFTVNEDEPLEVDVLIIDEASMLDLSLFYSVLKALPFGARLMLVGDVDQLPSVGAGDVLHDVIKSGIGHVTRLDTIFRQADTSQIISNAHLINSGEMPVLDNQSDDFFFFGNDSPEAAADLVVDIVQNRIPSRFNLDPLNDIQVLVPMYRGSVGIQVLNEKLQAALNPPGGRAQVRLNGMIMRAGDKVMQTKNNYDKDVFNGDIGRIHSIDSQNKTLYVMMEGRLVDYQFDETSELLLAYAVSVHRSQGSEYPAVVMPIMPQHHIMLQRNLLYTGVTRAKQLVVLVGKKGAINIAVNNAKVKHRYTALAWRLRK
jgi:exodeoxyribonuclease V alpha subunit